MVALLQYFWEFCGSFGHLHLAGRFSLYFYCKFSFFIVFILIFLIQLFLTDILCQLNRHKSHWRSKFFFHWLKPPDHLLDNTLISKTWYFAISKFEGGIWKNVIRAQCGRQFWSTAWLPTGQIWADHNFWIILNLSCKIMLGHFYAKVATSQSWHSQFQRISPRPSAKIFY